jgi:hypothetical protein
MLSYRGRGIIPHGSGHGSGKIDVYCPALSLYGLYRKPIPERFGAFKPNPSLTNLPS